jgi:hypothetical protein
LEHLHFRAHLHSITVTIEVSQCKIEYCKKIAMSFNPINNFRDSTSQAGRTSYDSGSGNEASDKALLEDEHDYDSEHSPYQRKDRRILKIVGFTLATVLCGLALVLSTWRITLNANRNCPTLEQQLETFDVQVVPKMSESPDPIEATSATDHASNKLHSGTKGDMFLFDEWKDCGRTADQARSKGCHFDVLLATWVHDDCFDSKLMERYMFLANYTYYRDYEMTDPISDEEIRRGDHRLSYSTPQQHNAHCGYVWEIQMRAWMRGRPISRGLFSYPHTMHCAGWLVDRPPTFNTMLVTDFDRCGKPKRAL